VEQSANADLNRHGKNNSSPNGALPLTEEVAKAPPKAATPLLSHRRSSSPISPPADVSFSDNIGSIRKSSNFTGSSNNLNNLNILKIM